MIVVYNLPGLIGGLVGVAAAVVAWLAAGGWAGPMAGLGLGAGAYAALTDRYPGGFRLNHVVDAMTPHEATTARVAVLGLPLLFAPYVAVLVYGLVLLGGPPEFRSATDAAVVLSAAVAGGGLTALTRGVRRAPPVPPRRGGRR